MEIFDGRYLTLNLCSISVQYHSCEHYILHCVNGYTVMYVNIKQLLLSLTLLEL